MKKKIIIAVLVGGCLIGGCGKSNIADVTLSPDAVAIEDINDLDEGAEPVVEEDVIEEEETDTAVEEAPVNHDIVPIESVLPITESWDIYTFTADVDKVTITSTEGTEEMSPKEFIGLFLPDRLFDPTPKMYGTLVLCQDLVQVKMRNFSSF